MAIVLVNEGGSRVVADAADKGIISKFGITLATLSGYRKKECTAMDVRNLTEAEARAIYLQNYWQPLRCSEMRSQALATSVLDAAVLTGTNNAARQLQTALGVVVDGQLGPKTLAAVVAADVVGTVRKFSQLMQSYLVQIVQRDATQSVWLVGWLKRAAVMQALPFLLP